MRQCVSCVDQAVRAGQCSGLGCRWVDSLKTLKVRLEIWKYEESDLTC